MFRKWGEEILSRRKRWVNYITYPREGSADKLTQLSHSDPCTMVTSGEPLVDTGRGRRSLLVGVGEEDREEADISDETLWKEKEGVCLRCEG